MGQTTDCTSNRAKLVRPAILCILFFTLSQRPAWAYLNPGDGSLLLQAIYASLASLAGIGGLYWRRLRAAIMRVLSFLPGRTKPGS